jgi:predicted negative regulator of RcsB-dependent stress response
MKNVKEWIHDNGFAVVVIVMVVIGVIGVGTVLAS